MTQVLNISRIFIHETMGISLGMGEDIPENIQAIDKISDRKMLVLFKTEASRLKIL